MSSSILWREKKLTFWVNDLSSELTIDKLFSYHLIHKSFTAVLNQVMFCHTRMLYQSQFCKDADTLDIINHLANNEEKTFAL